MTTQLTDDMGVTIKTEEPTAEGVGSQTERERPVVSFVLFAVVALAVLFMFSTTVGGLSFDNRDLVDTDGYMRYLRIETLLDGGEWFDPVFTRSNYPFGETSHWTRLLDVYVAGLALLLTPFLAGDALYWAAVWNGPLTFLAIGGTAYWALRPFLPTEMRTIVMPSILALPVVFLYTGPGRVDHHGAILVAVLAVIGWLIRLLDRPTRRGAVWLGLSLALGMWLSVEFLVALALTALTLGLFVLWRRDLARLSAQAFAIAALVMAAAVVVERGPAWSMAQADRISIAQVALTAAIALAFAVFARFEPVKLTARLGLLAGSTAASVGAAVWWYPILVSGPFSEVDPVVREVWLYQVAELKPITEYTSATWPMMVMVPIGLGLIVGVVESIRGKPWALLLTGWLSAFAVLTVFQIRWSLFAQMLALPLLLSGVAPLYEWIGKRRAAALFRPLIIVVFILAVPTAVIIADDGEDPGLAVCPITAGAEALADRGRSNVLASQDLGPEILYRTSHTVIATPYHRNEDGILFVHEVMAMSPGEARPHLTDRGVGHILLCRGRDDLTTPEDSSGTLYEALLEGPTPDWATPLDIEPGTDFLLFEVDA